jgi:hypothetical protein
MFIIPFIHKIRKVNTMTVHMIQILTIGGTTLWKESPSLQLEADILHPNGIYLEETPFQWKDVYFCKVDTTKTEMDDFYQWDEISKQSDMFCWRTFYTFGNELACDSWLPIPSHLEPYSCNDLIRCICHKEVI